MKKDFPLLTNIDIAYLDNASTTQKPKQVIQAIVDFYENSNANVHRGIYNLSQKASLMYAEAHETVAKFIGANEDEIIFTKGTTDSINILAQSLKKTLKEGDEIVISEMEHHSNIIPWQQVAKEVGARLKYIPITDKFELDMDKAKKLINKKTKIVSVVHMSNTLGTINPIKELTELAHKFGAVIIIDGAQSVPHMPIDVRDLDCDFLAFSGHKMVGPTGIGVLYGKRARLEKLDPSVFGGGMIKEVTKEAATWADLPEKFEAGTPAIAQAIGLAEAIRYLENIGMKKVFVHGQKLTKYAQEQLSKIEGIEIFGPEENRGSMIAFNVKGIHPHDVSEILNQKGVAVRAGNHCTMPLHNRFELQGSTRASFYIYNTEEDIDRLAKGIRTAKEILK